MSNLVLFGVSLLLIGVGIWRMAGDGAALSVVGGLLMLSVVASILIDFILPPRAKKQ